MSNLSIYITPVIKVRNIEVEELLASSPAQTMKLDIRFGTSGSIGGSDQIGSKQDNGNWNNGEEGEAGGNGWDND